MIKESDLTKSIYKPGDVAKMLGVTTKTIQVYCNDGKLQCEWSPTGRRLIPKENLINYLDGAGLLLRDTDGDRVDVVYARVSTHKQKERGDLDRQKEKVVMSIVDKNPKNLRIFTEVASGLNDNRRELNKLLRLVFDDKVDRIFVLHKDRLTRFGYNYLQTICANHGAQIIVISEEESNKTIEEELAEDIISIIHSFSGKLHDMRKEVLAEVNKELQ